MSASMEYGGNTILYKSLYLVKRLNTERFAEILLYNLSRSTHFVFQIVGSILIATCILPCLFKDLHKKLNFNFKLKSSSPQRFKFQGCSFINIKHFEGSCELLSRQSDVIPINVIFVLQTDFVYV